MAIEIQTETDVGRETVHLMSRELLVTTDPDMVVVRIFGSDAAGTAVRIGLSPSRALYLGFCFIRVALRLDSSLRLQAIETAMKHGVPDLKMVAEKL